jgi:hypothetical protein
MAPTAEAGIASGAIGDGPKSREPTAIALVALAAANLNRFVPAPGLGVGHAGALLN